MAASAEVTAEKVLRTVRTVLGPGEMPLHRPFIGQEDADMVRDTILHDPVGYEMIEHFETELARVCGVNHAVAVSSGTAALHLALLVLGVGPGDTVSMPTMTFVAAAAATRYCGAVPAFDVKAGPGTNIKARIGVHLLGRPDPEAMADDTVPVIEDAAEALGSTLFNRPCGSLGTIGILSFNNNKIVTTGGGGAVLTNDPDVAARVRHLATTAKIPGPFHYAHDAVGFNYRMGNINAAMGYGQLCRLPQILEAKREIAEAYASAFGGMMPNLPLASVMTENHWLNSIVLENDIQRDMVLQVLRQNGIAARALFTPIHLQAPYRDCLRDTRAAQAAEQRYQTTVCLPSGFMG